jgi:hypothetical protein
MSQDDNPYASPHTRHEPRAIRHRYAITVSRLFLQTDALLSLAMLVIGIFLLLSIPGGPILNSIVVLVFQFVPSLVGLTAFVLLMWQEKRRLTLAYVAGIVGGAPLLVLFFYGAWTGAVISEYSLMLCSVRAAWNIAYIFAARAFAKIGDVGNLG